MILRPRIQKLFATSVLIAATGTSGQARAADPTTADCIGASEKSIALRNQHKLRAARSELLVCATSSCPADIRAECSRRVDEVNAAMPTIVFEAKDASGSDLSAVKVTMDGQPLVERLEGTALSIDPGEHSFVFETAGQEPIQKTFVIVEGSKDRRERIVFGGGGGAADTSTAGTLNARQNEAVATSPRGDSGAASSGDTQRILGWSAAGLGVIGIGLGIVFEAQRSGKLGDADAVCPTGVDCPLGSNARIQSLTDDAKSASTMAAVSFVAGGVLVAGGLTLVFTAPRSGGGVAATPILGPTFQGVVLNGHLW